MVWRVNPLILPNWPYRSRAAAAPGIQGISGNRANRRAARRQLPARNNHKPQGSGTGKPDDAGWAQHRARASRTPSQAQGYTRDGGKQGGEHRAGQRGCHHLASPLQAPREAAVPLSNVSKPAAKAPIPHPTPCQNCPFHSACTNVLC